MTLRAFDLDECLVSTRAAHEAAYRSAGIEPPTGREKYKPRDAWLPDTFDNQQRVLVKHSRFYRSLGLYGKLLPAYYQFFRPQDYILTGCSKESADSIMRRFPELRRGTLIGTGMSADAKIEWLLVCKRGGIYFDDWPAMVDRVRRETTWQSIDVSRF